MTATTSNFLFPAILVFVGITGWIALPQRLQRDAGSSEITPAQAQRYLWIYRAWCIGFAVIGVVLATLTLVGR